MSARPLPPGYICRKCGIPGHWIHDCLKGKPSTQSHLVLPTPQQLHERNQQLMLSGHGQPNVYFPSYGIPSIPPPMPLMPYFMMPLEGPSQSVIQQQEDSRWIESWLEERGIKKREVKTKSEVIDSLLSSWDLYQQTKAGYQKNNTEDFQDEELKKQLSNNMEKIHLTLDSIENGPELIKKFELASHKKNRKKKWKKRRMKSLKQAKEDQKNNHQKLNSLMDQWREEFFENKKKEKILETKLPLKKISKLKKKQEILTEYHTLLKKTGQLRNLRQNKAKEKGIFHLEEEKKFKDQYEKLLNVIKTEETNLENAISKLEEKKQKIQETILPTPNFYFQAENNIKSFIDIRREWDRYLVPKETEGSSCLPLNFVPLVPPSSSLWENFIFVKKED